MTRWVCLLVALGLSLGAAANELPDFGSPADTILNKTREGQLGRSVMLQLYNAGVIVSDPELTEYVQSVGARVASAANNGDHSFRFFVVNDPAINAFALPGGFIGVNTGLILASENESELAGVLAHEVAHVTQRHIARSLYDAQRTNILSMAAMLAAALLGAAADMPGDALAGVVSASQAAAIQRQLNFTRAHEQEADRVGMDVLAAAGFDPMGMASFFEKLSRRYGTSLETVPEILQSHPVTTSRIAESRNRARRLERRETTDSISYRLARARIEANMPSNPRSAVANFEAKPEPDSAENRYGRGLALTRLGRHDEAERLFRDLLTEYPGVIAYRTALGQALANSGLDAQAIDVFQTGVTLFPRNVPLTVAYAETLIRTGQPEKAHRLLLDLLNNVRPTPEQIRLIARAANAEGDTLNAYYYMGEYYVSIGNLPLAMNQLRLALELPDAHTVDRARLQARLKELRDFLPEEQRRDVIGGWSDDEPEPEPERGAPPA